MGPRSALDRVCMFSGAHLIRHSQQLLGVTYPCVLHGANVPVGDHVGVESVIPGVYS